MTLIPNIFFEVNSDYYFFPETVDSNLRPSAAKATVYPLSHDVSKKYLKYFLLFISCLFYKV